MPLGNVTGMTEEERELLGAWIRQGAKTSRLRACSRSPSATSASSRASRRSCAADRGGVPPAAAARVADHPRALERRGGWIPLGDLTSGSARRMRRATRARASSSSTRAASARPSCCSRTARRVREQGRRARGQPLRHGRRGHRAPPRAGRRALFWEGRSRSSSSREEALDLEGGDPAARDVADSPHHPLGVGFGFHPRPVVDDTGFRAHVTVPDSRRFRAVIGLAPSNSRLASRQVEHLARGRHAAAALDPEQPAAATGAPSSARLPSRPRAPRGRSRPPRPGPAARPRVDDEPDGGAPHRSIDELVVGRPAAEAGGRTSSSTRTTSTSRNVIPPAVSFSKLRTVADVGRPAGASIGQPHATRTSSA